MASGSPQSGVGRVIAGRYLLLNRLGSGGMGHVWLAHDQRLACEVALKEIVFRSPSEASDERTARVARARAEARHAAGLRGHPHVVTVHDVLEHEGLPWIVMEYVAGALDLRTLVHQHGPPAPAECARIGLAVLDALTAGHERGIMHRDVKPANILLAPDRTGAPHARVLLTDYGISVQPDAGETRYTLTSALVGTPGYLAPERATGGPPTAAADLFSLGCTLYFGVEGCGPFERDTHLAEVTAVVMEEPRTPLRAGALEPVLAAMLAKDPGERISSENAEAALSAIVTPQSHPRTQVDLGSQPPWAGLDGPTQTAYPGGGPGSYGPSDGPDAGGAPPGQGAGAVPSGPGPGTGPASGHGSGYVPTAGNGQGYIPTSGGLNGYVPTSANGTGYAPPSGHANGYAPPPGHGPGSVPAPGQGTGSGTIGPGASSDQPFRSGPWAADPPPGLFGQGAFGRPPGDPGFGAPVPVPGRRRRKRPRVLQAVVAFGLGLVLALSGVWYAMAHRTTDEGGDGKPYGDGIALTKALKDGDCVLADWPGDPFQGGTPQLTVVTNCAGKPDGQVMAVIEYASADEARKRGPGECEQSTQEIREKLPDVRGYAVVPTSAGFEAAERRTACLVLGAHGSVYGPLGDHRKLGMQFVDTANMQKRDCLDTPSDRAARLVSCSGPHDQQVIGFTRLGAETTLAQAKDKSDRACAENVPPREYGFDPVVYEAASWTGRSAWKSGTHFVVCTVRKQNGGTMEGDGP